MRQFLYLLLVVVFSFLNVSCMHHHRKKHKKYKKDAVATIAPVNDSKVSGWVSFHKQEDKKVLVKAHVKGLKPNKKYGFHVHKFGDCRENGKNAGPHLNPHKGEHGSPENKKRHMGDLGNLVAGKDGTAKYEAVLDSMCMYKIGGRSVIVHANEDDLSSQPSGNAGPYIGCGVVGYMKSHYDHCKSEYKKRGSKCEGKSYYKKDEYKDDSKKEDSKADAKKDASKETKKMMTDKSNEEKATDKLKKEDSKKSYDKEEKKADKPKKEDSKANDEESSVKKN